MTAVTVASTRHAGRIGTPADVASLIGASLVTGTIMPVDGGLTMA